MNTWGWITIFFVLAVGISGAATWFGARAGRAVPTAFGELFAAVEEQRTFMGLPIILGVARRNRWVLIIVAFAIAPSVAAVVLEVAGAPGDLAAALRPWRDDLTTDALLTYGVIAVVFAIGCLWYLRITRSAIAAEQIDTPPLLRGRTGRDVAARLAVGTVVDEGGTLEELGWRGLLLPLVLLELDRGPATLIVAVMWWAWHLPREVPGWSRQPSHRLFLKNQAIFIGTCVALSVLCTEAFLRTGGSVWPAVLIHGGTNVWAKALGDGPYACYHTDVRTVIVGGLAVLCVIGWVV